MTAADSHDAKGKNDVMKRISAKLLVLLCAAALWVPALARADAPSTVNPDEALKVLLAGNQRFVDGNLNSVTRDEMAQRRAELIQGQKPFAIVLCCSDSRVGPEIVFDQELGNIFVVRTAGEVLDAAGIGSIEYAVAHLGSPLVLVLGHEYCGAVAAAVADAKEPGCIANIVKAIRPAVAKTKGQPGDPLHNAVLANVRDIAARLRSTGPVLSDGVKAGRLKVASAVFSLKTGKVELVSEEPK
jgi:carbonic anhydrase